MWRITWKEVFRSLRISTFTCSHVPYYQEKSSMSWFPGKWEATDLMIDGNLEWKARWLLSKNHGSPEKPPICWLMDEESCRLCRLQSDVLDSLGKQFYLMENDINTCCFACPSRHMLTHIFDCDARWEVRFTPWPVYMPPDTHTYAHAHT